MNHFELVLHLSLPSAINHSVDFIFRCTIHCILSVYKQQFALKRCSYIFCGWVLGPAVPPPPSNISASHPLLVRQAEPHAVTGSMAARIHRAGRPQRGTYRYNPNTQTLHVHYTAAGARPHNPPAILQRQVILLLQSV